MKPFAKHQNEAIALRATSTSEKIREPQQWQHARAVGNELVVFQSVHRGRSDLQHFADSGLEHGVLFAVDGHDQRVGDRQRQRQLDHKSGAFLWGRFKREGPVELLDRAPNHVHADAAALSRSLVADSESGCTSISAVQRRPGASETMPVARAPRKNLLEIDALTIVFHFQRDSLAVRAPQSILASAGLPATRSSGFKPWLMALRQVKKRMHHPLDRELIDFRVFAGQLERSPLKLVRQIANAGAFARISRNGTMHA